MAIFYLQKKRLVQFEASRGAQSVTVNTTGSKFDSY